ncbi:hypothetical protein TNCV_3577151 [Trichonephila clavipes]|uniref:Uncharacterized protein n=1 Tax=Trichonephila clavipes TaxID=2585209 RepID=A0A8X6RD51_TRICX|nr:hypothetical protein TNCV_3577151 [Trichonephila clavipes]
MSDRGPQNLSHLRAGFLHLSLALATCRFARFNDNFEGENRGQGLHLPLFPIHLPHEDLRLDGYLEYPLAAVALYIYKHPCLLRDSKPVPTAPQSASLTTISDGRLKIGYKAVKF